MLQRVLHHSSNLSEFFVECIYFAPDGQAKARGTCEDWLRPGDELLIDNEWVIRKLFRVTQIMVGMGATDWEAEFVRELWPEEDLTPVTKTDEFLAVAGLGRILEANED